MKKINSLIKKQSYQQFAACTVFFVLAVFVNEVLSSQKTDDGYTLPVIVLLLIPFCLGMFFLVNGIYIRFIYSGKLSSVLSEKNSQLAEIETEYFNYGENSGISRILGLKKIMIYFKTRELKKYYLLVSPSDFSEIISYLRNNCRSARFSIKRFEYNDRGASGNSTTYIPAPDFL